jgi:hypothetical protein
MKRLPSCYRKTPINRDDECPDFYELAKSSPLPDVTCSRQGSRTGGTAAAALGIANDHATTMASILLNANKSGNYHPSLQGYTSREQCHYSKWSNVITQNYMGFLRQQQQQSPPNHGGSLQGSFHVPFAQLPATMAPAIPVQYRLPKEDAMSGNELIQIRSIECNYLMAQKLALMHHMFSNDDEHQS